MLTLERSPRPMDNIDDVSSTSPQSRSVQQIDQKTSAVINRSLTDNEYFTVIAARHCLPA